jgi:hypothetical protein
MEYIMYCIAGALSAIASAWPMTLHSSAPIGDIAKALLYNGIKAPKSEIHEDIIKVIVQSDCDWQRTLGWAGHGWVGPGLETMTNDGKETVAASLLQLFCSVLIISYLLFCGTPFSLPFFSVSA